MSLCVVCQARVDRKLCCNTSNPTLRSIQPTSCGCRWVEDLMWSRSRSHSRRRAGDVDMAVAIKVVRRRRQFIHNLRPNHHIPNFPPTAACTDFQANFKINHSHGTRHSEDTRRWRERLRRCVCASFTLHHRRVNHLRLRVP